MKQRPSLVDLERVHPQHLISGLWAAIALLGVGLSFLPPSASGDAWKILGTSAVGLILSFGVTRLSERALALPRRRGLPLLVLVIVVGGSLLWLIDTLLQITTVPGGPSLAAFAQRRYNWVYFSMLFGLQAIVLALIHATRTLATRERELVAAQLAALRFQVNPHFLFNTLNAVSTLVSEKDGPAAEEMIAKLADFLGITLSEDLATRVPLRRECETIQAYLEIETVRFGERLQFRWSCDETAADVLVPSLILQPLVENAVKFAVAPATGDVVIIVSASVIAGQLVLTVEDRAAPDSPLPRRPTANGGGVGLQNVARRLEAQHGSAAALETKVLAHGFAATIRLPVSFIDPPSEAPSGTPRGAAAHPRSAP